MLWSPPGVRTIQPEMLDSASEKDAQRNLDDLRRIHRYLGGDWILRSLLRKWYRREDAFTLLDVGAGGCVVRETLRRYFPNARVISVDLCERNLRRGAGTRVVGDAFRLPFALGSVDVVCCNLFLHHFSFDEVQGLLQAMGEVSRRGVVAIDLERHWLARGFLPATNWLFRWGRLTLHDGPVSVDAGFQGQELEQLARAAGLDGVRMRWHLPWFRLSLACQR